jgi:hypothetical protein
MKRFIEGENRLQSSLFPESLEDYIAEDNSIRIVDAILVLIVPSRVTRGGRGIYPQRC